MIQSLAITLLVTLVIVAVLALAVERDEPNLEG